MKQEAKKKNLRLSYIPKDMPYTIVGNYYKISNILKYLITNAIEYNAKGAITVTVNSFDKAHQAVKYDKPKEVVLAFIIKSSTPILSKEDEQLIYCYNKRFNLNIAIVKQLINEMGGELDVISTEKESTVFVCFLPITLPFIDNIINEIE